MGARHRHGVIPWRQPAPAPAPRASLGGRLRRTGAALLNQQCWAFGQDVRHPEGNLLLSRGFVRHRSPPGVPPASTYLLDEPALQVQLWGFGIFARRPPGPALFLRRYGFRPRLGLDAPVPAAVFTPAEAARHCRPVRGDVAHAQVLGLLGQLAQWLASYERWVAEMAGPAWREESLRSWDHPAVPGRAMALAWERLARQLLATSSPCGRRGGTPPAPFP